MNRTTKIIFSTLITLMLTSCATMNRIKLVRNSNEVTNAENYTLDKNESNASSSRIAEMENSITEVEKEIRVEPISYAKTNEVYRIAKIVPKSMNKLNIQSSIKKPFDKMKSTFFQRNMKDIKKSSPLFYDIQRIISFLLIVCVVIGAICLYSIYKSGSMISFYLLIACAVVFLGLLVYAAINGILFDVLRLV